MSKEKMSHKGEKVSTSEKAAKFYRNLNIIGAIALGGAAVIAPPAIAAPAAVLAGINVLEAGGGEALRRHRKRKRLKKSG